MEEEAEEVATKAKDTDVEVDLPENTVNLELLLITRDCVVPYATTSLTKVKRNHRIKLELHGRS